MPNLVLQVFMVRPNHERLHRPLQPMTPFLQRQHQSQQLTVPDVVIPLGQGQAPAKVGAGMQLLVLGKQNSYNFNHDLFNAVKPSQEFSQLQINVLFCQI